MLYERKKKERKKERKERKKRKKKCTNVEKKSELKNYPKYINEKSPWFVKSIGTCRSGLNKRKVKRKA